MDPVNNVPDNAAKPSGLAANILSSLNASFSSGGLADKLFANILSQNQPPLPKPQADTQTTPLSASQTQQQVSQNNGADNQNVSNPVSPATNQTAFSHGWQVIGKSPRHDAKPAGDKNKSQDTGSKTADNTPPAVQTNTVAGTQPDAVNNTANAAVTATTAVTQADPSANNPPSDNSNANADPANAPVLAGDLNAPVNAPATSSTPAAPGTSTPVPAQTSDTPAASNDNTDTTGAATNGDVNASQLTLLLMQLERLAAAARLADPTAVNANAANLPAAQDPNATSATPATGDTQGKTDLKALLAALAKSNGASFLGDNLTGQTGSTGASQDSQNAATTANATPSAQNAPPPSNPSNAQQTATDKWMNANFVNLFNLADTSQNNTGIPVALGSLVNTGVATGNDDGAALDTEAQNQNGAGSHDVAANTTPLSNNLLPTAGTLQAASPYDFASQLSAMRATKGGATGLPTPIEQVVLQLSRGLSKDGSTQMSIQLRPAELGRIDVKINVSSDGKVQGTVTADNPATLGLLLKDVRGLERALQEAGLRADSGSLQFNLRGDGQTGGSFGQTADNSSGFSGDGVSSNASTSLPVFADAPETYYLTPGGVNMRV